MKYYKILIGNEIKGVASSQNFFIENFGKLISSTDSLGQFVEYDGQLYRDYWMAPIPNNTRFYLNASITEISREDYFAYIQAKQAGETVIIDDDEPEPEPTPIPNPIEEPDAMLEYIRSSKLAEMSAICRQRIEAGVDVALRGETYHFSLTTQDQLNLMNLSTMLQTENLIPYHADGEPYEYYTAEEMTEIIAAANNHKLYHTAYYNALKEYINSLTTVEDIAAITYGIPVPEEYQSDVLKML